MPIGQEILKGSETEYCTLWLKPYIKRQTTENDHLPIITFAASFYLVQHQHLTQNLNFISPVLHSIG